MREIISPKKHKAILVSIAALSSFLGFEAASQALQVYQIGFFLRISLYIYLFLVCLQIFVFDLHLRKPRSLVGLERNLKTAFRERFEYLANRHHFLHFQNYLLLPGITFWTTVAMLYLNPFEQALKQGIIIISTLALAANFWYLKTVFLAHKDARGLTRQLIFLIKFWASYLAFAASFGITRYFGNGQQWFVAAVFTLSFLLLYQAMFQHHETGFETLKFLLGTSFFLSLVGFFLYFFWNVNYFSGALVLTAVYNTIWGIIHHKWIDKNLTKELTYEYLAVLFLILVIVFGTTNFALRI